MGQVSLSQIWFGKCALRRLGPLAQSVEQRTFNPWVVGSIPTGPTFGIKIKLALSKRERKVKLLIS